MRKHPSTVVAAGLVLAAGLLVTGTAAAAPPAAGSSSPSAPCDPMRGELPPLPPDFSVVHQRAISFPGASSSSELRLGSDGVVVEEGRDFRRTPGPPAAPTARATLSAEAMRRIHGRVVACRFFELPTSIGPTNLADGWMTTLTITAGGRTHAVHTRGPSVRRVDEIVAALRREIAPRPR